MKQAPARKEPTAIREKFPILISYAYLRKMSEEAIDCLGVGVVMTGQHMCMASRGVEQKFSSMRTSCLLGALREDAKARSEFLSQIGRAWCRERVSDYV